MRRKSQRPSRPTSPRRQTRPLTKRPNVQLHAGQESLRGRSSQDLKMLRSVALVAAAVAWTPVATSAAGTEAVEVEYGISSSAAFMEFQDEHMLVDVDVMNMPASRRLLKWVSPQTVSVMLVLSQNYRASWQTHTAAAIVPAFLLFLQP